MLLVRHGESAPYVEGKTIELCDGQDDPHLAPEGQRQAERLGERLATERIDAIYVTSLRRTVETATPLSERTGLPLQVIAELREVHMGEWEGGTFRQRIADRDPLIAKMRAAERWDLVPGAEATEAFRARIGVGIEKIAARHPGGRVVVVTHFGTIATIVAMATGSRPFAFLRANNGSISTMIVTGEQWLIRSFNDSSHLRDLES
jgi:probable phosphoglycerate mutase